jgi:CBS domain containing-hemolysin-like protein
MDADPVSSVLLFFALIIASGFFVAVEFAIVTLRRGRVEQVVRESSGSARSAFHAAEKAEEISLLAQFGSVLSTLLLGHVSVGLAASVLPGVSTTLAAAIGLCATAAIFVILGQQIPRFLGAQRSSWIVHPLVIFPLRAVALILRPLTAALSLVLNAASIPLRLSRSAFYAPVYTLEDIRELVTQGHQQGVVEEDEREMIHGVFEFSATVAREVMTPRIDIVAVPHGVGIEALIDLVVNEGHSRIPVYEGTIDNIVGVLLTKDLLSLLADVEWARDAPFDITTLMREPYFVPDTKPVDDILAEFRQSSVHLAIVIDEFGGTSGLVTMEDLLEEIVGEINDEYDVDEPDFAPTPEGDVLIDGGASISEVNERFGLGISESDYDTIGGYVFGALGRVPVAGDRVDGVGDLGAGVLEVEEIEERRVTRVRLRREGSVMTPEA